ncbi:carbohydrate ABC transporter permease [Rugosimonospora acidiphila]|uniref:Carbohydrate ABC transporter permease n=1 Tax=Rugosimonospora acidiphila TaxID=556531 RepID=A0ABP9S4D7_9ACTN
MTKPTTARPIPARRRHPRRLAGAVVRRVFAVLLGCLFIAPLYWVLTTSLARNGDVYKFPPSLIPHWHFGNYARAWDAAPWLRLFGNTVLIASATVLLALFTSVLAGFAFGVLRFRGRKVLFALVMSVMLIPQTVLLIPVYIIAQTIDWLDTYWIQIIPWGASVFGIFLVRQFFAGLPEELFDAAELDGAGRLRMLWSVGVPLVRPALLIVGLNVFMGSWNSFLWPFIMTSSGSHVQPVEVGLATFYGTDGTDWTGLSAAVAFTTVPVLALFLVLQKHFVTGAYSTAAGLRG